MSWTPGMVKLACPTCGNTAEGITLSLDYAFIDGVRHRTTETWIIQPCGDILQDHLADWVTDETEDGEMWSALVEKDTERVLLAWQETVEEIIYCDCEDCDGEDCDCDAEDD